MSETARTGDAADRDWMERALELARKGRYSVSPNPLVGAVVVRDDKLLGEGWHERAGQAHAEIRAFESATENLRGSTLYVTLEPCNHHGRTPPCTDAIIAEGISRVVVATLDPSESMAGKSLSILREAGVEIVSGVLENEASHLNEVFLRSVRSKRPFVALKVAMTLDGKLATANGRSKWITSEHSRERGLELREEYDAILVGSRTVTSDDPSLTRRLGLNSSIQPWTRIVLDSSGALPLAAKVLNDGAARTLVYTPEAARYESLRCEAVVAPASNGRVDLAFVLADLDRRGLRSVMVEGGPTVASEIIHRRLWDKLYAFVAPLLVGGDSRHSLHPGDPASSLDLADRFRFASAELLEPDVLLVAYPS